MLPVQEDSGTKMVVRRIGVVGYGHLGQYLAECINNHPHLELAFVWNRSQSVLENKIDTSLICHDLLECHAFSPDLIIEVAHPVITEKYGRHFLSGADYLIGSPTALANQSVEDEIRSAAKDYGVYIPSGAFWGAEDILKMANRGSLKNLKVTMKKSPKSFKLESPLKEINETVTNSPVTLYEGPVRQLCSLAPNNVNTMAASAIAGHNLGFDNVIGCLISDPSLQNWHIVEVEVEGPIIGENQFKVHTVRMNPADTGAVTGTATFASFFSSLLVATGKGPGIHVC